jgi:hypothetical protein
MARPSEIAIVPAKSKPAQEKPMMLHTFELTGGHHLLSPRITDGRLLLIGRRVGCFAEVFVLLYP